MAGFFHVVLGIATAQRGAVGAWRGSAAAGDRSATAVRAGGPASQWRLQRCRICASSAQAVGATAARLIRAVHDLRSRLAQPRRTGAVLRAQGTTFVLDGKVSSNGHQTHVPALGREAQANARLPGSHEDPERSRDHRSAPRQGPQAPRRLSLQRCPLPASVIRQAAGCARRRSSRQWSPATAVPLQAPGGADAAFLARRRASRR